MDIQNHPDIDHFFICIDAEEESIEKRHQEVEQVIHQTLANVSYSIIVQNRTIETWFLGNRRIVCRSPQGESLRKCLQHYSVVEKDPEGLPVPEDYTGNHANYHSFYLNEIFSEHKMTYRKNNPGEVLEESYFNQLLQRIETTDHLASFKSFVCTCHKLGAAPPKQFPQC